MTSFGLCRQRHGHGGGWLACRRQMPGPIRRDCPLRANEQVVYTPYTRRNKVGRGGVVSGINFGIAAHNGRVFIPVSDVPDGRSYDTPARPGIYALDVDTGEYLWQAPSKDDTYGGRPGCYPGYSAAITVTDEYVLAGGNDGWLRAFDVATGDILWSFDTTQTFTTVDGGTATGGAIGGGQGPLVIGDRLILDSGYAFAGKMLGNLLLVLRAPQSEE